ncbi:holo-ACP synthase [Paraphotobacterium marinum]|uniref:holo-ACP synthase n=1 Tax=Paraphotobacterium marinum TaxID=1755811 RepID=UPI0039EB068D
MANIIGIGIDICEILRIKRLYEKYNHSFLKKILTEKEIQDFYERNESLSFLAGRFAAKESIVKALGTGFTGGISFQDFTVFNDKYGAPKLDIMNNALEIKEAKNINQIHLSISHEKNYAVASVILEK